MIKIPPSVELEISNCVRPFDVFAILLSSNAKTLLFNMPVVCALAFKESIFEFVKLPISKKHLTYVGRQLNDTSLIPALYLTVHHYLCLRGGKGGFGSLLHGAATKAGQKKTNNFDACQDMSGRRLRHVNAEKKLEDWRAKEDERRLGKIAEDLIRKAAKKAKGDWMKKRCINVEKYREESAKCVAQVEISVRDAIGFYMTFRRNLKRKGGEDAALDGKKLKIW